MGMLLYQMRNTRSCLVILNLQILSIWKKCHDRNMSILPTTDLKQLKTVFAGPSIDFLKEHSAKANYELIPRSEYEILKIIDNPGSEFIQTKASKYGLVAVTEEEYDSLTDPTKESLIENASKLGLSVIENWNWNC